MRIYGYGRGGKHRDTNEAATWRLLTAQIASTLRCVYPELPIDLVQTYAADEALRTIVRYNMLHPQEI